MTQQPHYWVETPRKPKLHVPPMFIAALFTIASTWKQPRCLLTDEWIKKMWNIYTMEYCSIMIRDETGSFLQMIRMNLESVIQSEVSQKEKSKCHMLMCIYGIQKTGTDNPICMAVIETQMWRMDLWIQWEKREGGTN